MSSEYRLDINQIQKFLPHRAPFLLVDRILEIHPVGDLSAPPPVAEVGTKVVALKNVTFNEPYFEGHFPGFSIVPGVLLLETMAQAASFSVYPNMSRHPGSIRENFQCILVGVESARFRRPVVPGDSLRIETEVVRNRGNLWVFRCTGSVDGQKIAEADIMANLLTQQNKVHS